MTTRTTPSTSEIVADASLRDAALAGAAVIALDVELNAVLFADAAGRAIVGPPGAAATPTLRQVRSAARQLAEAGHARVSLRQSTRAGTKMIEAALMLRPADGARAPFVLLTIPDLGRPLDDADLVAAVAPPESAACTFVEGLLHYATASFDAASGSALAADVAAFEAGEDAIATRDAGEIRWTLVRAPFGRTVAWAEARPAPAAEVPAPERLPSQAPASLPSAEAPEASAGFATFSVKRAKLGERRPGMSMGALLERWHSRGPEAPAERTGPETGSALPDATERTDAPATTAEENPAELSSPAVLDALPGEQAQPDVQELEDDTPLDVIASEPADDETPADRETLDAADGAEAPVVPPTTDADISTAAEPSDQPDTTLALEAPAPIAEPALATDAAPEEARDGSAPVRSVAAAGAPAFVPRFDVPPVRFVWQIDREGAFRFLSPDFAGAVGPNAADVVGRSFATVSKVFGFDETREIARLLERRDTWSGRTIFWPIEGSDRKAPVDLAALPVYGRDRSFDGFRGFGIVRLNESVPDEEGLGLHLTQGPAPARDDAPDATCGDEAPAAEPPREKPFLRRFEAESFGRRVEPPVEPEAAPEADSAQKVIRLEERRRPREGVLSTAEEAAFRAIGAKLGSKAEAESPGALRFEEPAVPEQAPEDAAGAPSPQMAKAGTGAALSSAVTDPIEPALEALSEKLARAEAEADRRLASRKPPAETDAPPAPVEDTAALDAPLAAAEPQRLDVAAEAGESSTASGEVSAGLPDGAASAVEALAFEPAAGAEARETAQDLDEDDEDEPPLDVAVFERLFAGLPLAVLVQVRETTVYSNAEFARLTGHADAEAVEAAGGLDALVLDRQGEGTLALVRADGEVVEVRAHMQRIAEGGRSALLMSFLSVADEEAAAIPALEDLRQEVEELQAVLDTATDGVVLLDSSGNIRAMNGSAHALFGIGVDEAFGRHLSSLFAHESQKATVDYLDMLRDDGIGGILNDGREVIGRVSQGGFIPLFITIGRLTGERGWCVVIRDIAHWKRIEEDLVNARRQAEAASLHKSRFLANISHELRTPLNAIIGFADVMSSECFGPIGNERYLEYLGDIKRSGHHVLDLVNDLLDISKIEAGKVDLSFEAVSLNEVISEAVSLMQPQANRERVIVRSNLPSSVPPVVADRRTMRQIALNLLANAIRFTPAGGQIIASTTYAAEGDVLLRFRDSGIGMTEREIELALTPFQQVHAPSANRGEGTGLGLPLTKAMVEANRAYFSIQSTPGEGTLVEIVFPAPRVLAE
ncbi:MULTISPECIES: histidine kinase dimerization/phospho-acceptor domain-containing protein [unclassified Aureimonas]|uniref:histidine kinase dimerization/phospho-acceptor domain-containing protein n=1 Tax=unclassified Aureimonas TaxID=2615206 RepID=UPI0006F83CF5|nr:MULTISPECIES: histidine kinase dimerization/phospho-acceptor domain-containing protein [unclassified Aureimonas]KQT69779.1 hypothetical protein ASG62_01305 [Aureimonas sp. Leaf427]KQT76069.1 hypothetical protein ASG54_14915 [Aureimonas sp. Leaf460]